MKVTLTLLIVAISISAMCQNLKPIIPKVVFEVHGFIDGIRLDSIKSEFAEVNLQNNYIYFDYGQQWMSLGNYRVLDISGNLLSFERNTIGVTLNFMDYNGWEYVNSCQPQNSTQYFIFRKKKKQ